MLLRACLIVLVTHVVFGCNEDDRRIFLDMLQYVCPFANRMQISLSDNIVSCGSELQPNQAYITPFVKYLAANEDKEYALLLVSKDYPFPQSLYIPPRLERIETGIQGWKLKSGYQIKWNSLTCTVGCLSTLHNMTYKFILLEQQGYIPDYMDQHVLDLWGFMDTFGMCYPVATSEYHVPSQQV